MGSPRISVDIHALAAASVKSGSLRSAPRLQDVDARLISSIALCVIMPTGFLRAKKKPEHSLPAPDFAEKLAEERFDPGGRESPRCRARG